MATLTFYILLDASKYEICKLGLVAGSTLIKIFLTIPTS